MTPFVMRLEAFRLIYYVKIAAHCNVIYDQFLHYVN